MGIFLSCSQFPRPFGFDKLSIFLSCWDFTALWLRSSEYLFASGWVIFQGTSWPFGSDRWYLLFRVGLAADSSQAWNPPRRGLIKSLSEVSSEESSELSSHQMPMRESLGQILRAERSSNLGRRMARRIPPTQSAHQTPPYMVGTPPGVFTAFPLVQPSLCQSSATMAEFTKFEEAQVSGQPPISVELMTLLTAATVAQVHSGWLQGAWYCNVWSFLFSLADDLPDLRQALSEMFNVDKKHGPLHRLEASKLVEVW